MKKLLLTVNLLTIIDLAVLRLGCCNESSISTYSGVWNSPTKTCESYRLKFDLSNYDIVQNTNDSFNGENITIFYGPGEFPKIDRTTGVYTNGGIPQLGNLSLHLEKLMQDVEDLIPDKYFQGLAVLDFEQWRPLYKHNFDALDIYQKASEELVKKQHPNWTNSTQIKEEAEKQFNTAGRSFFESTLNKVRELRPNGKWGYYGFPRCYGQHGNFCAPGSQEDNDLLDWLWSASSALYPRIYLAEDTNQTEKILFLMATVHEAVRVADNQPPGHLVVYPYSRHSYDGSPGHYYTQKDLYYSHYISSFFGGNGVVVWGSTKSMESKTLCTTLHSYISSSIGPFIRGLTLYAWQCSVDHCSQHGQCIYNEIPAKLNFLDGLYGDQKEWMRYFFELMSNVEHGKTLDENFEVSCKCYPNWKGTHCSEPN